MGLTTTTLTGHGTLVTSPVIAQHIEVRVRTDGSSSSNVENTHSLDGTLYRVLSMQDDMKTLQYPTRLKNEFDIFIDMAEQHTAGTLVDANFDLLNTYLGTL